MAAGFSTAQAGYGPRVYLSLPLDGSCSNQVDLTSLCTPADGRYIGRHIACRRISHNADEPSGVAPM